MVHIITHDVHVCMIHVALVVLNKYVCNIVCHIARGINKRDISSKMTRRELSIFTTFTNAHACTYVA